MRLGLAKSWIEFATIAVGVFDRFHGSSSQEPTIPAIPPPLQMDPNRAFQAHNLETLEAAFAQANLAFPPQQVCPC